MTYELQTRTDGIWLVYASGEQAGPFPDMLAAKTWAEAVKEYQKGPGHI